MPFRSGKTLLPVGCYGITRNQQLGDNLDEVSRCTVQMDHSYIQHQISKKAEKTDESVLVHVRKQYNDKAEVKKESATG